MHHFNPYTLNVGGQMKTVESPLVMGILNTTPDSFYAGSRCDSDRLIRERVRQIVGEGKPALSTSADIPRARMPTTFLRKKSSAGSPSV